MARIAAWLLPLALLVAGTASAQISAPSQNAVSTPGLSIGMSGPATSVDPHFYNTQPNNALAAHIFDRLVERMPDTKLVPGLALDWRPLSDTVWEFKLRPGVRWQDGEALTPDDIAFSLTRARSVPNSPGGFGGLLSSIERVEIVDATTVHLHTKGPSPIVPNNLAAVAIVSRHVGDGADTAAYNSGKAAIGTGPYRLARFVPGDRVELVRNEFWWGDKPEWSTVTLRFMPNTASRTAALLAGDIDIIEQPAATDLPQLRSDPRITLASIQGVRMILLAPDFSRQGESPYVTDNTGVRLPRNPLLDRQVRQALSIAINRPVLVDRLLQGIADPAGQWMPPGTFGFNPAVKPPEYDPAQAKQLLAAAGFPDGFRLTLQAPNDRYPADAATAQAIAQMWTRVGVRTEVETLPFSSYSARGGRQEFAIGLWGFAASTGEASYALVNALDSYDPKTGRGSSNQGRYANRALDTLVERAVATVDDSLREAMLREAVQMVADDVGIIPLYQARNTWAMRRGLSYDARMDERSLAMNVHGKP